MRRRLDRMLNHEASLGLLLIAPAFLVIGGLIFYPVLYNFWLSVHKLSFIPGTPADFVGLSQYQRIFADPEFWAAIRTTLIFTASTVLGSTFFGFLVALLLNREFRLRGLVRGIVLLPYVAPVISLVFAWQYIFHPVYGFFNYFLVDILGILPEPVAWLQMPRYALFAVIVFDIWRQFPFAFLMIMARLQAIPTELYEAADVDGAVGWQKVLYITIPEIIFVVGSIVLLRGIWNVYKFGEVYLLSRHVNVLSVYAYEQAFASYEHGLAAAITTSIFLMLLGFIILYIRKVLKW